jgi:hypothetical protein
VGDRNKTVYFLFVWNSCFMLCNQESENTDGDATNNTFAKQTWIFSAPISRFACKCIVGCIFTSTGVIVTREMPCI